MKRLLIGLSLLTVGGLPVFAWGELDGGVGMEYFSVQAYTRDHDGRYFQTLVQSTLAKARVKYAAAGFFGQVTGGLNDWQSSGEWGGTVNYVDDRYLWVWQQQFSAELGYEFNRWQMGLSYGDHDLQNYYGNTARVFYRLRTTEAFLNFTAYENSSTRIVLGGGYAFKTAIELYENGYFAEDNGEITSYEVNSAGEGRRWRGRVALQYRDSANWGIDVLYDAGWAQFFDPSNLSEISLRFGSLTGFFVLWF